MANTRTPHYRQTSLSQPIFFGKTPTTHRDVLQDKSAAVGERRASSQPERTTTPLRSPQLSNNFSRSQILSDLAEPTVPLTLHVPRFIRTQVEQKARANGGKKPLSLSAVGGAVLARGLQQDVDMQYGATLKPAFKQVVREEMRSLRSFLLLLLARIAFDTGQTRAIAINILSRQPDLPTMTEDVRTHILTNSSKSAKGNLTAKTPQLRELIEALDQAMGSEEEGDRHMRHGNR